MIQRNKWNLENKVVETPQLEQQKEWTENSLRDLWDNIKHVNIHIIGVPEGEGRNRKTIWGNKEWKLS